MKVLATSRLTKAIVLVLIPGIFLNGCMTTTLWTVKDTYTEEHVVRQATASGSYVSAEKNELCFRFDDTEWARGRIGKTLTLGMSRPQMDFINRYALDPSLLKVQSIFGRLVPTSSDLKKGTSRKKNAIDPMVQFKVPEEQLAITDGRYSRETFLPASRPSLSNRIIAAMAARTVYGEIPGHEMIEPVAWVDSAGAVIQDAAAFEETSCDRAIKEGAALLLSARDDKNTAFIKAPADVLCRYNCGALHNCTDLKLVTINKDDTANLVLDHPIPIIDPPKDGCLGPDWAELRFPAGAPRFSNVESMTAIAPDPYEGRRVLATPFTVVFDVLTLPIQAIIFVGFVTYTAIVAYQFSHAGRTY